MTSVGHPRSRGPVRVVAVAVVVAVLLAGCSSRGSSRGAPPPSPGASATLDDLRAAGVLVVASEADAVEPTHGQFLITQVQADRMLAEQASGGGILGSDIDDVAPMPADAPPMSYLLAGWISNPQTPTATAASRLMGTRDWKHAPSLVFPTAILAMFVADAASAVDAAATASGEPDPSATGSALGAPARVAMVPVAMMAPADGGPCSAVTDFLASTIKGLFDALHLTVPRNGGFFGTIVTVLATAWDTAVSLAQGIVSGIVDTLTAPVFEVMRIAIGALGVATTVVSYLKDQELTVTLDPGATTTDTYRFAVDAEADIKGDFVATAKSLTGDWPAALKDCAKVSGADLPELIVVGGKATWVVLDNEGLIAPGPLETQVRSDRSAHLTFATGRESQEQATKGEPRFDVAALRIDIPRKELGTFLDFAQGQIAGVRGQILSKIPQADLRNLADAKLGEILDPTVKRLRSEVENLVGGVFMLSGTGVVVVKHHGAPEPSATPSPPSASPTDGDFCKRYGEMVQWAYDHQGTMLSSEWAGEIARQLAAMQPLAPPSLASDVTVMGDIYTLIANQTVAAVIGNEVATKDFPGAAMRVGTFCKIDPSRFSLN